MKQSKLHLKHLLEYLFFMSLATAVRILPRRMALALGAALGRAARPLMGGVSKIAHDNLARAFPNMPEAEIRAKTRGVFEHIGKGGIEMLRLDLLKGQRDLDELFTFEGLERLKEAYALGKGVILLTGHVGFWEGGTFFLPQMGFPTDFVARRMKNPYADRFITRLREAGGGKCLDSKHGARRIIRSLNENRGVAILLDQNASPRKGGIVVDFFGRPAHTTPIVTRIAMKTGAPVVPVFVYRTPDNLYHTEIGEMVILENEPGQEAVVRNTTLLTKIIEDAVRKDLTQWFWVHRRWRVKPEEKAGSTKPPQT